MFQNRALTFLHLEHQVHQGLLGLLKRQMLGLVSLIVGIILAIPGVPGPGFVFIALAFLLIDFPGKKRVILSLRNRRWFRVSRVLIRKKLKILLVLPTKAPVS
ncbi:MAG: hypothetical protein HQL95_09040 [Magnetococcales bacterium]|nr:hypothetical protein [Magnetococcales bacterium]